MEASKSEKRSHLLLLIVLGSLTAFPAICTDMYLTAFPTIAHQFGVHIADMQLTLTTSLIGTGFGQIIYGPLSDRYGRKRPMLYGIALFLIATIFCALSTNLSSMIFWRFFQALGGSAAVVIARAVARDRFSGDELSKAMSGMSMVFLLSPILGPSLGSLILHWGSWPWIFYALVFFGIYCFIAVMRLEESHPADNRNSHGFVRVAVTYGNILKNAEFRAASVITMGAGFITFAYVSSSPAVLMGTYGVDKGRFGLIFGIIALGLVASNRINMKLVSKYGVHKMLRGFTAMQSTAAVFLLIAALVKAPLWILILTIALSFGCAPGLGGNTMTLAMHPFPQNAGAASALVGLIQALSSAFIAALLATAHSGSLPKMGIAMFVGAMIAFIQVRRIKQPS